MPVRCARAGLWSMLILASTTWPLRSCTRRSRMGVSIRQGAHHAAQKSTITSTSCDRRKTACSKSASCTSKIHGELDVLMLHSHLNQESAGRPDDTAAPPCSYDILRPASLTRGVAVPAWAWNLLGRRNGEAAGAGGNLRKPPRVA